MLDINYIIDKIKEYIWLIKTYRIIAIGYIKCWIRNKLKKNKFK